MHFKQLAKRAFVGARFKNLLEKFPIKSVNRILLKILPVDLVR